MIGRKSSRQVQEEAEVEPRGFDDYELKLGDLMRGERATMGKSLLDVQRELRIRASYVAAIENADPSVFDTPGFIAGYVRSYARYLDMDPDKVYAAFCEESGFSTAHGMSPSASSIRKPSTDKPLTGLGDRDPFAMPSTPFVPLEDSLLSRIEPRAIGSMLVLVGLIGAIGFGGWTVLNEIQRVQFAPVENTPDVLSDLDPLDAAVASAAAAEPAETADPAGGDALAEVTREAAGVFAPPRDALDRLYRPQALDVPVLVARDAPISTLDPASVGSFATAANPPRPETPDGPGTLGDFAADDPSVVVGPNGPLPVRAPQVVEEAAPQLALFAVRPAWVRVRSAEGTIIFEKILDAGEKYVVPALEEAPVFQAGMSGSIYFEVNGDLYGPAGRGTNTIRNVALSVDGLKEDYQVADLSRDPVAAKVYALAEAQTTAPQQPVE